MDNQELVELDSMPKEPPIIEDLEDTESEIDYNFESSSGPQDVKLEQALPDLSFSRRSETPDPQFFTIFDNDSTSTIKSAYSPPLTRSRAHMEDTILRSGWVLLPRQN